MKFLLNCNFLLVIKYFLTLRFNYTALRLVLDEEISSKKKRNGKFLGQNRIPKLLSNIGKMLDMKQVLKEIETSIMSTVSCNACRGGKILILLFVYYILF